MSVIRPASTKRPSQTNMMQTRRSSSGTPRPSPSGNSAPSPVNAAQRQSHHGSNGLHADLRHRARSDAYTVQRHDWSRDTHRQCGRSPDRASEKRCRSQDQAFCCLVHWWDNRTSWDDVPAMVKHHSLERFLSINGDGAYGRRSRSRSRSIT